MSEGGSTRGHSPDPSQGSSSAGVGVRVLLGPTNTGKTHRAVERMLEHESGMIGLPLRLLAREVYERVCAQCDPDEVALITGEEKRVPRGRKAVRWWICTVEAMPLSREVDFLAVDEIQMIGHRQRGHIFCARLLHARGRLETWFMGAETVRDLVRELVPTAHFDRLTRLSQLRHAPPISLGALRPRTALVAFSAAEVYELAEKLRARRGGAAVVLGALSPRARNAQVAMYQAGEVDFMVATDAIGMGLNMDVDHVVFAGLKKFDGEQPRELYPQEVAQIAGRAGRWQRDGSFAVLSPLSDFEPRLVDALENHRFAPLRRAYWRNIDLDFDSIEALLDSLKRRPPAGRPLRQAPRADDYEALEQLAAVPAVREHAKGRKRVELLWEVCQVPDFRKLLLGQHAEMLTRIYLDLTGPAERIDTQWMRSQIDRIDDTDAGIDLLMTRMAFIRTWTYVAGQGSWVRDASQWRARTQAVEDRLSDALHDALVARFVQSGAGAGYGARPDERSEPLWRPRPQTRVAPVAPEADSPFAGLVDLRDKLEAEDAPPPEAERLAGAPDDEFTLRPTGRVEWGGHTLAQLTASRRLDRPNLRLADPPWGGSWSARERELVHARLGAWIEARVAVLMAPVDAVEFEAESREAAAWSGLAHALREGLGCAYLLHRGLRGLPWSPALRRRARAGGIEIGKRWAFVRANLHGHALTTRAALLSAASELEFEGVLGARTLGVDEDASFAPGVLEALGYARVSEGRIARIDCVERALRQIDGGARAKEPASQVSARVLEGLGLGVEGEARDGNRGISSMLVAWSGWSSHADGSWSQRRAERGGRRARGRRRRSGRGST